MCVEEWCGGGESGDGECFWGTGSVQKLVMIVRGCVFVVCCVFLCAYS